MKKILLLVALSALAWFGYQASLSPATVTAKARPLPNVVVAKAAMQTVRDEVEAIGTSKAFDSVTITAKVSEIISTVNIVDGQNVKQGELLIQLQNTEQQAKVRVAEVKLAEHNREFARIQSLVSNKTIAENEQDRLQTLIDTTKAELIQAGSALADRAITAPFSGRLGLIQVSTGSLVTPGQQITTLDDVSQIKLDFSVPERFINEIQVGKQVEAKAIAFPGRLFSGKVTSIDSRVNPTTRAVIVRAIIANADFALLPGMLMKVKLIKQSREALLLPESAIIPIQSEHYIYTLDSDNKVVRQQVTLGARTRGWVEITQGVELDQAVIIRGILKVRPGDKVQVELQERFKFVKLNSEDDVA
ncbi:efflux RND transporter periplasmic adaptor subunit [Shewanella sp. SR44-3]|uniref:efflux RND transporter periplasmic adaptor subunit n=1 Tax=unclassified Shewanella TaxID=196818 RepID=UPI0015F8E7B4|nr:efflux RND transporter periplasmic adaptor subunit [Shewanella sp. SR44-3]MBB1267926.1 efflux RND transporter periplasmic adaptor subunit [Shewanella sp. SR44-3]